MPSIGGKITNRFAAHVPDLATLNIPLATEISEFRQQLADLDQAHASDVRWPWTVPIRTDAAGEKNA